MADLQQKEELLERQRPLQQEFARLIFSLPEDDWLDRDQLADDLGVTPRTITSYTMMKNGIPHVRWGVRTRYRVGSVKAWLLARETFPGREKSSGRRRKAS